MKIIVCDNYEEISKKAADIGAGEINNKPDCVLGLATGSTPVGMYNILAQMNKEGSVDFENVRSFNLDEYYPLSADNEQSYHYFMNENLFSKVNINKNNTHILDGMCSDTEAECDAFEKLIEDNGGIDLQILGIGQNGHIGFNEPDENLNLRTHLTDLTENTIEANSRFFDDVSEVPTKALTMGIGTILKAKKIILLANGKNKHEAVKSLLTGSISTEMPASMLKVHTDVTLICDKEAFSSDRIGIDIGGTEIKFGVLNEDNKLLYKDSIPTSGTNAEEIIKDIAAECRKIMKNYTITGIGVGTPGRIRNGLVSAVNLPFKALNLAEVLSAIFSIPVKVSNDANCAALAESVCGAGKSADNILMLSLGTGIGGGIIIGGKIYEGRGSAGEIGHMSIDYSGKPCPCGEKGCFERYASAAALVSMAEKAAKDNTDSLLYELYQKNGGKLNGKLFFEAVGNDCAVSQSVLDEYTGYLAAGIKSLTNIFDPDMIILSGGITNAEDALLGSLKKHLNEEIKISELKSDAGMIGAALLVE